MRNLTRHHERKTDRTADCRYSRLPLPWFASTPWCAQPPPARSSSTHSRTAAAARLLGDRLRQAPTVSLVFVSVIAAFSMSYLLVPGAAALVGLAFQRCGWAVAHSVKRAMSDVDRPTVQMPGES